MLGLEGRGRGQDWKFFIDPCPCSDKVLGSSNTPQGSSSGTREFGQEASPKYPICS
jgi:hypothetical protein